MTLLKYSLPMLEAVAKEGGLQVLRRLCTGEARFTELSEFVHNTRTLTRRLKELATAGLIVKADSRYRITGAGFETALAVVEVEGRISRGRVNFEELAELRYGWMKVSLMRLTELFLEEFRGELISLVTYGSAVRGPFKPGESDIDLLYLLEDGSKDPWGREERVFAGFRSSWEYRACNYWLRGQGAYGYPEVTTASLKRSYAKSFHPVYLDMLFYRAILYDTEGIFQDIMRRLQRALEALGTVRIEHPDGVYAWLLKPGAAPSEPIEVSLE